ALFRVYRMTWRFVGLYDFLNLTLALVLSGLFLVVLSIPTSLFTNLVITGFPKRILFADGVISLFLIAGLRISKRIYLEVIREKRPFKKGKRTIIIGAGNTGEMILRDMIRQNFSEYYPVGFLDDDRVKLGTSIHGVRVLGTTETLGDVISKHNAYALIIAIPSLSYKILREIYNAAKTYHVDTIKIVPRIYDFSKPKINLKTLEDISIEDLVGREVVRVDYKGIKDFIRDKVVLVTGAGGSIGSELVFQVCAFEPRKIILLDNDDTDLHYMELKIRNMYPHLYETSHFVIGDIRDEKRLQEVFETFHPHMVFHAAAYKHVPMMEHNSKEAVKVNIFGTYTLAKVSVECGVETFVMISTDKAVMPTSVMGATKRMAEYVCGAFNEISHQPSAISHQPESTRFISVRFGNVLGSRGSVLPLFLEQLKYGGPLTVTHKDMKRYFMTIPEAVSLVLQASMMGEGNEVFVLDMGEPAHIVQLAEELIRLHGLEPYKDIDIEFIGLRPGEKLFEELLTSEEGTHATQHEKVFIAKNTEQFSIDEIEIMLTEFQGLLNGPSKESEEKIRDLLKKYIKHYEPGT
ncbi:MAG: nucleoside-diphosphate sugar epimerase/dehydratase, partial [Proteobacteria bacterium]|nr:nucleoside-diphosphate sugar epimerase/dehydratase [Pseudomonadota bacterium]